MVWQWFDSSQAFYIDDIPTESGHDGCTDGAVRLVNSTIEHEGRVEVCYDGIWGAVCYVNIADAIVICNTLGYGGGRFVGYHY